jgi:hypothetical protein
MLHGYWAVHLKLAIRENDVAISDALIPELRVRFANRGLRCGSPPDPVAVFPAQCEGLGDLKILDDGDEVTIYLGDVTHGHVNPYDEATTTEAAVEWITSEVVEFLEELFSDRVVFWGIRGGGSSGWQMSFGGDIPRSIPREAEVFVWSRRLR